MATYLLVTRIPEAELLDLRQALMDEWPTIEWHGAPIVLANGEQIGVFSAPPSCTLPRLQHALRLLGVRRSEVFPAPVWARVHEVRDVLDLGPAAPATA